MAFTSPDGQEVAVHVPPGTAPGSLILVQYRPLQRTATPPGSAPAPAQQLPSTAAPVAAVPQQMGNAANAATATEAAQPVGVPAHVGPRLPVAPATRPAEHDRHAACVQWILYGLAWALCSVGWIAGLFWLGPVLWLGIGASYYCRSPQGRLQVPLQRAPALASLVTCGGLCALLAAALPWSSAPLQPAMAVKQQLAAVQVAVQAAAAARAAALKAPQPASVRLVAVSKTKPVELLQEAYEAGHRYFGENYVQELVEKAPQMPEDVQWHFIGHLQSNKISTLVKGCPSLACLETIDSEKLARAVDRAWQTVYPDRKLRVMIQVNSSGEQSKNGVEPEEVAGLCQVIATECEGLELAGLMTIGAPDYSGCRVEDFQTLHKCREEAAAVLGVDTESLELSMGMSADYENAIREGSSSVRVGSSIFGARSYPAKA